MINKLKALAVAAVVAVAPVAAGAASITSSGVSGDFMCDGAFGLPAASIDVIEGGSFNAVFENGEAGGTYCFDLVNSSDTDAVVTVAVASVNQSGSLWGFLDGVSIAGVVTETIAQGEDWAENFKFAIAAGSSVIFDWTFGEAYATGNAKPDIDFTVVAAVPLPAGGLLLIGALGALGVARRRKS